MDTGGNITEHPVAAQAAQDNLLTGPDGSLWSLSGNSIYKLDSTGSVVAEYPLAIGSPESNPIFGPDGNLWYANGTFGGTNSVIIRMTTSGSYTSFALPSDVYSAGGIISGPSGDLWFATYTASGVSVNSITTAGIITTYPVYTAGLVNPQFPAL